MVLRSDLSQQDGNKISPQAGARLIVSITKIETQRGKTNTFPSLLVNAGQPIGS